MSVALMSHRGALDPGRWSPQQLGTLSLWLDADDPTTITLATGVSEWRDKSGNGHNVSQPTGGQQPSWARSARYGRAGITFDNTKNQKLFVVDELDLRTGGASVAVVFACTSGGTIVSKVNNNFDANGEWGLTGGAFVAQIGGSTRSAGGASTTDGSWHLDAGVLDRSASITRWRDGTQEATVTAGFPNTTDYDTGANFVVGGRYNDTGQSVSGTLAEAVVSMATWSTDDRQKVEGYLGHKWGLTSLLPADHPYKKIAP